MISVTDSRNGGAMIRRNSALPMPNLVYRYRFCGLPNGVSIPPRLAAMFCMMKVNDIRCCLFAVCSTK